MGVPKNGICIFSFKRIQVAFLSDYLKFGTFLFYFFYFPFMLLVGLVRWTKQWSWLSHWMLTTKLWTIVGSSLNRVDYRIEFYRPICVLSSVIPTVELTIASHPTNQTVYYCQFFAQSSWLCITTKLYIIVGLKIGNCADSWLHCTQLPCPKWRNHRSID